MLLIISLCNARASAVSAEGPPGAEEVGWGAAPLGRYEEGLSLRSVVVAHLGKTLIRRISKQAT